MKSLAGRRRAAAAVALAASFVAAVALARLVGPALLLDREPSWALPRLLLGLSTVAAAVIAGALAGELFFLGSGTPMARGRLEPLPLSERALVALAAAALLLGTAARFVSLPGVPEPLWIDDVSLIDTALALGGRPSDFADAVRPAPAGVARPYGTVGVLYLEFYRLSLRLCGTTVFGVRLPSALAGSLSIATAGLLGRALLPRGGGALAAIVLAGLRWSLILSRWGWVQIALAPILDVAALLVLRARRRGRAAPALAGGAVAGLGAHVYLAAWIAAAGLAAFAAWPAPRGAPAERLRRAGLVLLGFALAAAPLFLFREGRRAPYFARAGDHNVAREVVRQRSLFPPLAAAADSLTGLWALADPSARNDLPGRRRLGWIVGVPAFLAFARALARPREDLSALLVSQAGAAMAAAVAGGQADVPNGARFAYWTTLVAVAAAAGTLALVGTAPARLRRAAAIAAVGLLSVSGARGAKDALVLWPARRETFDAFHGQDTLIGRAAARWRAEGEVALEPGLGHSDVLVSAVAKYRLGPPAPRPDTTSPRRRFRVAAARTSPEPGERIVEAVADAWGRSWAVVLSRAGAS